MSTTSQSRYLITFRHGEAGDWRASFHEFVVVEGATDHGAAANAFHEQAPHYYEGMSMYLVEVREIPPTGPVPLRTTREPIVVPSV